MADRLRPEPPVVIAAAAVVAVGVVGTAIAAVWPELKDWWRHRRAPSSLARVGELASPNGPAIDRLAREVESALSTAGAQRDRRLAELLLAASIVGARGDNDPRLRSVLDRLATQEVTDAVNRALESDELDEETSAIVVRVFGPAPLRREAVETALRLAQPSEA